jgi:hypothetical protein
MRTLEATKFGSDLPSLQGRLRTLPRKCFGDREYAHRQPQATEAVKKAAKYDRRFLESVRLTTAA